MGATRTAKRAGALPGKGSVLVEIEGCVLDGNGLVEGAAALLDHLGDRALLLSGNAQHTAESYAQALERSGLVVPPSRIVLAGVAAVTEAALRFPGLPTLVLGPRALVELAQTLGLPAGGEAPEVVLLAADPDLARSRFDRAVAALERGARLVAASADPWILDPGPPPRRRIGPGAVLAAIEALLPGIDATVVGLPQATLLRHALARAGTDPAPLLLAAPGRADAAAEAGIGYLPVDPDGGLARFLAA